MFICMNVFSLFINKMNSNDELNQLLHFIQKMELNSPERRVYCNMCDCALIFDGLRGYCLEMWSALNMCMFKAALQEFPHSSYICVLWILKVQYVRVLGVLIRSRTTQAWEDGTRLRHRAKKITPLPQAPSSWWAPPPSRLSRLHNIRERAPAHPPGPATHPPAPLVSGVRASSLGISYATAPDIYSSLRRWLRWGGDGWRWQVGWCMWGERGDIGACGRRRAACGCSKRRVACIPLDGAKWSIYMLVYSVSFFLQYKCVWYCFFSS